jgi:hypothetical protein
MNQIDFIIKKIKRLEFEAKRRKKHTDRDTERERITQTHDSVIEWRSRLRDELRGQLYKEIAKVDEQIRRCPSPELYQRRQLLTGKLATTNFENEMEKLI